MSFNGADGFSAGVCACAAKPANGKTARTISETRNEFKLAPVFATRDKSSRIGIKLTSRCVDRRKALAREPKVLDYAATKPAQFQLLGCATLRRDLSIAFCRPCARSGRSRKFVRQLQRRARQSGNCNVRKPAPARGWRTRSCRRCDAARPRPLQTPCRIRSHKLRMYPYINLSRAGRSAAVF
jgi:hypothetical protein